jgi:hypothetical protein
MKRIYKNNLGRNIMILVFLLSGLCACKEQERFEIGYSDSEPPSAPVFLSYVPLYGGAKIFYEIPSDEDLLSIDASYVNTKGETVWFSRSYYTDSIEVYGFNDTLTHVIQLYAVDRAGNRSKTVSVPVIPMEPAVTRVASSLVVKPGFASFFIDWTNELEQNMNVYVDFDYTQQGAHKEHKLIYTSNLPEERWFIRDLNLTSQEPVKVKVRVEDMYGNMTDYIDKGQITLLEDELIPKNKWYLPEPNDSIGGVPMAFLAGLNMGGKEYVIDDIIDDGITLNFIHTNNRGRTGMAKHGNLPWNIMIDLGDEYEISRIVTHQRFYAPGNTSSPRGQYYGIENVAVYSMYIWDADEEKWDSIRQHKIPYKEGMSDMEYKQAGQAGDMAYLYPDDPQFSKPTRWFRYEALFGFAGNYTSTVNIVNLSEITLYGRKKN